MERQRETGGGGGGGGGREVCSRSYSGETTLTLGTRHLA